MVVIRAVLVVFGFVLACLAAALTLVLTLTVVRRTARRHDEEMSIS